MNKLEITKYLAKEMGWTVKGDFKNNTIPSYCDDEGNWIMYVGDFDPFNDIHHAFMVVEWMAQQKFYISITYDPFYVSFLWWKVAISGWEQSKDTDERGQDPAYLITLAAFKALAPAELQERLL